MYEDTKTLSKGAKLGLFGVFAVVWLVLCLLAYKVITPFKEGGWGMWPILAVGMVAVMIIIERTKYLFITIVMDRRKFIAEVQKQLMAGNVTGAISYCQATRQPMATIVAAGLSHLNRPDEEVQDAVDEAALHELPKIEKRSGYLAMIGNISTLLGLLGTIIGLIKAFAGVSVGNINDPATAVRAKQYVHMVPACQGLKTPRAIVTCIDQNKATILASGISEAMNCTAFGLGVGILALLAFSVLNGRTQGMLDNISDGTVYLMNLAVGNRRTMKVS